MDEDLENVPLLLGSKYTTNHSTNSDGTGHQDSEGEEEVQFFQKSLDKNRYGAINGENESDFRPYSLSCFGFRHKSLKRYARDLYHWILSRQHQWTDDLRKSHTQIVFPIRHPGNVVPPVARLPAYIPKKVANLSSLEWLILPTKTGLEKCRISAISVQSNPDAWENVQLVVHSMEGGSAQVSGAAVASLIPQGPRIPSVATFSDIRIRRAGSYVLEVRGVLRPHISVIAPVPIHIGKVIENPPWNVPTVKISLGLHSGCPSSSIAEPNLRNSEASYSKQTSEDTFVFFGPLIGLWTSTEALSF
ncbi:hypothetical protein RvY_17404 [Ramazzottius varieornatus]|uniref:Uncharacterized protein n=1 Tax=Ramazzottius varieornatus TaxID=947166 RepID=A0A1D1W206_RAMVA|nr:hypothetical protein RvY_17404 [Ramazzottius varieornatus]